MFSRFREGTTPISFKCSMTGEGYWAPWELTRGTAQRGAPCAPQCCPVSNGTLPSLGLPEDRRTQRYIIPAFAAHPAQACRWYERLSDEEGG